MEEKFNLKDTPTVEKRVGDQYNVVTFKASRFAARKHSRKSKKKYPLNQKITQFYPKMVTREQFEDFMKEDRQWKVELANELQQIKATLHTHGQNRLYIATEMVARLESIQTEVTRFNAPILDYNLTNSWGINNEQPLTPISEELLKTLQCDETLMEQLAAL
jgi:hypothetical protein